MQIGDFKFDDHKFEAMLGNRELRKLTLMDNGAKYTGEWLLDSNIREGRGTQVWPDGSMYEGYWKDNRTTGRGRLIHSDGDVYDGEWLND